jgi:hypothetical protein
MKKLFVALMTVLFLGSTTGMVLADGTAPATTPTVKVSHKAKKAKKVKKMKAAQTAPSTTPVAK